jgi:N-acetylneuraminate synthase
MNPGHVYVIAEAGVNHNGQRELAFQLVDAAARAGVDAVKFQTFSADKLTAATAPKAAYQQRTTDAVESQLEMLRRLELPREWHHDLNAHAAAHGVHFMSTAFDLESLLFLQEFDMPFIKVPSGELTNGPLLWEFARFRKPLLVSTGMATLSEVEQALAVIAHALNAEREPASLAEVWRGWSRQDWRATLLGRVTLLHCTSQYPTPHDEANLRAMDTLANAFGLPVGYSDHTEGVLVPVAAVARGACVIEKHFTVDRSLPGPDQKASLEPDELARMVKELRAVAQLLGDGRKAPQPSEWDTRQAAYQQVIAARPIVAGAMIARSDLATARCGAGLPAIALWDLVGTMATRSFEVGQPLSA